MKFIKIIAIVLIILIALVVVVGLFLPKDFTVKRSVHIDTNPTHVSVYIVNLNQWPHWSPWKDFDETMHTTLGDQIHGVGAHQSWTGDSSTGRLEFTAVSKERVDFTCYFEETQSEAACYLSFVPKADGTQVEWAMSGSVDTPIVGGYFALLMDSMVGPMFEHGLDKMKRAAEQRRDEQSAAEAEPATTATTSDQEPACRVVA